MVKETLLEQNISPCESTADCFVKVIFHYHAWVDNHVLELVRKKLQRDN